MSKRQLFILGFLVALIALLSFLSFVFQREWGHRTNLTVEQTDDSEFLLRQIESDLNQARKWQEQMAESLGVAEKLLVERLISLENEKIFKLIDLTYYQMGQKPEGAEHPASEQTPAQLREAIALLRQQLSKDMSPAQREEVLHRIEDALVDLRTRLRAANLLAIPASPQPARRPREALILDRLSRIRKNQKGADELASIRTLELPAGLIGQVRTLWTIFDKRKNLEAAEQDLQVQSTVWQIAGRQAQSDHDKARRELEQLGRDPAVDTDRLAALDLTHDLHEGVAQTSAAIGAIVLEQAQSLGQWRDNLRDTRNQVIVKLIGRLLILLLIVVLILGLGWAVGRVPNRWVADEKSRFYFGKIVSFATFFAIFLAVLFSIVGEFGAVGPVIGLAGAGLAIALQDVIVSVVGWFFIIGRMGLSVGDRVEIKDVKGDVIDIGVFRTALLEVGNWVTADQSTGRVVFFPNSFVFRGHFFNYHGGSQYVWDEIHTLVTFESDWRHAHDVILNIAKDVLTAHIETAQRQMARMARRYLLKIGKLSPIVYVQIQSSGIDLVLRYLVPVRERRTHFDILSRRILDFVESDQRVELAYETRRTIQDVTHAKPVE